MNEHNSTPVVWVRPTQEELAELAYCGRCGPLPPKPDKGILVIADRCGLTILLDGTGKVAYLKYYGTATFPEAGNIEADTVQNY